MADRNWTGNANRAPGVIDEDDPFAALTRLVEIDAEREADAHEPAPSDDAASGFDLEAELLQEFERYDAAASDDVDGADDEVTGASVHEAAPEMSEPPESEQAEAEDPDVVDDTEDPETVGGTFLEGDLEAAMAQELDVFADSAEEDEGFEVEPSFSGPVPDLDDEPAFENVEAAVEEAAFAGPVPDLDDLSADEFGIEDSDIAFAGPTPDFDFEADFSAAPTGAGILDDIAADEDDLSADDMMAGELELSLGIPEKEAPAVSEPASAFAEWKNERLSVNSSTQEVSWVPEPVLGHPGEALSGTEDQEEEVALSASGEVTAEFADEDEAVVEPEDVKAVETAVSEEIDPLAELQAIMGKTPVAAPAVSNVTTTDDSDLDIDFDTLEMDLASVELDELEDIVLDDEEVRDPPAADAPDTATFIFDPSQITEVDPDAEFIADLEIPQVPDVDDVAPAVASRNYDLEFESDMAELLNENIAGPLSVEDPVAVDDSTTEAFEKELTEELQVTAPSSGEYSRDLLEFQEYDEHVDLLARNRRGGVWVAAAAVAAVVVIVGGAYAWLNSGTGSDTVFAGGNGEPPVIMADKTPFKEVPADKGGAVVPNQDKAVYDKVEGNSVDTVKQESLINSEEAPVDVADQASLQNVLPLEINGEEDAAGIPQDDRLLPGQETQQPAQNEQKPATIAPRKVKTMIVMPDGTLVARETPEPAATTTAGSVDAASADDSATQAAIPAAEPDTGAQSAVEQVANADVDVTAPVRPVKITEVPGMPVPTPRPTEQPVNVVSTVTERGNVAAPETQTASASAAEQVQQPEPATPQKTSIPPGTYVIQIASLTSQESAEKTYANLASRFSSVIGGRGVDIQRADITGKGTYYRVRVPAGTRDEAIALCERYKAAGGSCLVSR